MGQLNPFGQRDLGGLPDVNVTVDEVSYVIPLGAIAQAIEELVSFFEWLFGGSSPTIPRQLLHARHPLYPVILGVQDGLIPDEASEGKCKFCGDPAPCPNARPLRKAEDAYQSPNSGQYWQSLHGIPPFAVCMGLVGGYNAESMISCVGQSINCGSTLFGNPEGPAGCVGALGPCAITGAIIAGCYGVSRNIKQPAPPEGTQ